MKEDLVSIIMPAYNSEKYISESIESALKQTYKNIELIVIDDCSKDNTKKIVMDYQKKDDRVKYYKNNINKGVGYCRNIGVKKSQGKWIAFLDSDDLWKKEKIEKQVSFVNNNKNANFVFTASSFIDENGNLFNYQLRIPYRIKYRQLLLQNLISCSSVFILKDLMLHNDMPKGFIHEDFATWLTILQKEEYAYGIDEPLLFYRITSKSKSGNKIKAAKMNWNTYRYLKISFFSRIICMFFYCIKSLKKYSSMKNGGKYDKL